MSPQFCMDGGSYNLVTSYSRFIIGTGVAIYGSKIQLSYMLSSLQNRCNFWVFEKRVFEVKK